MEAGPSTARQDIIEITSSNTERGLAVWTLLLRGDIDAVKHDGRAVSRLSAEIRHRCRSRQHFASSRPSIFFRSLLISVFFALILADPVLHILNYKIPDCCPRKSLSLDRRIRFLGSLSSLPSDLVVPSPANPLLLPILFTLNANTSTSATNLIEGSESCLRGSLLLTLSEWRKILAERGDPPLASFKREHRSTSKTRGKEIHSKNAWFCPEFNSEDAPPKSLTTPKSLWSNISSLSTTRLGCSRSRRTSTASLRDAITLRSLRGVIKIMLENANTTRRMGRGNGSVIRMGVEVWTAW